MYLVRAISTTNTEPRYDGCIECSTFADVQNYLAKNPGVFYGHGADILDSSDNVLFHTNDYQTASTTIDRNGNERTVVPTLKACVAAAAESANY